MFILIVGRFLSVESLCEGNSYKTLRILFYQNRNDVNSSTFTRQKNVDSYNAIYTTNNKGIILTYLIYD